jgi:excisionase family DNA binding protein
MQASKISERERDRRALQSIASREQIRVAWRINDACAALGISRSHLYELAAAGKVRLVKIGHRTVIPDDEVRRIAREGA